MKCRYEMQTWFTITPVLQLNKYWKAAKEGTKIKNGRKRNEFEPLSPCDLLPGYSLGHLTRPPREEEAWTHHKRREEPKEQIAVVFLVDSEVAGIALDVGTRQISDQTQSPGWNTRWMNEISRGHCCCRILYMNQTFVDGPLFQVRSEEKRGAGVDPVQGWDKVRFSAEKRRAGLRGVQTETQKQEAKRLRPQPANTNITDIRQRRWSVMCDHTHTWLRLQPDCKKTRLNLTSSLISFLWKRSRLRRLREVNRSDVDWLEPPNPL